MITEAPHDEHGNLCHHPLEHGYRISTEWRQIEPFQASLTLQHMIRGRSAAYFIWSDDVMGVQYPMFLTDMETLIKSGIPIVYGRTAITTWTICKRGQNYGVRLWSGDND